MVAEALVVVEERVVAEALAVRKLCVKFLQEVMVVPVVPVVPVVQEVQGKQE
mgnify:CR=1 FL=1